MTHPTPILDVQDLRKYFPVRKGLLRRVTGQVHAVDGISLTIAPGETLGLVGESGCGKSTAGKTILKLMEPTGGRIALEGRDITGLDRAMMRPIRQDMQIIFQDPYSSLNPRIRAGAIVGEPFAIHHIAWGSDRTDRVAALFRRVGLRTADMAKLPGEFSGGQRQRIGIARALASNPRLIIADEPVSALDVSIQAQIVNLLVDLQAEFKMSYLFIAHDLAVVKHISHRVAVMYLGGIVELAGKRALFTQPLHPYTQALLSAVPRSSPGAKAERYVLGGDVPSPINRPSGCHFHPRCPSAMPHCRQVKPVYREVRPDHFVACHLHDPA